VRAIQAENVAPKADASRPGGLGPSPASALSRDFLDSCSPTTAVGLPGDSITDREVRKCPNSGDAMSAGLNRHGV